MTTLLSWLCCMCPSPCLTCVLWWDYGQVQEDDDDDDDDDD